jgi:hypothetical protein
VSVALLDVPAITTLWPEVVREQDEAESPNYITEINDARTEV